MEDGVIVVPVEGQLKEVAACKRRLFREEFDGDLAESCVDDRGCGGLGFEVVDCGHGGGAQSRCAAEPNG